MNNNQNGIPISRASKGKIIPNLSPDSFYDALYASIHDFSVQVADSDLDLGPNVDAHREQVVEFLNHLAEQGLDVSEVNVELQARYNTVQDDCLSTLATLIQGTVYQKYKNLDANKPRIISPF